MPGRQHEMNYFRVFMFNTQPYSLITITSQAAEPRLPGGLLGSSIEFPFSLFLTIFSHFSCVFCFYRRDVQ